MKTKTIFNPCDLCDERDSKSCKESCVQLSHFRYNPQFKVGEEVAWEAWNTMCNLHYSYDSEDERKKEFKTWFEYFKSTHPELFGNNEQRK